MEWGVNNQKQGGNTVHKGLLLKDVWAVTSISRVLTSGSGNNPLLVGLQADFMDFLLDVLLGFCSLLAVISFIQQHCYFEFLKVHYICEKQ